MPEFRFAINIVRQQKFPSRFQLLTSVWSFAAKDPIQFRLYASATTKQGAALNMLLFPAGSAPFVASLPGLPMVAVSVKVSPNLTQLVLMRLSASGDSFQIQPFSSVAQSTSDISTLSSVQTGPGQFFLVASGSGNSAVWVVDTSSGKILPQCRLEASFQSFHLVNGVNGSTQVLGLSSSGSTIRLIAGNLDLFSCAFTASPGFPITIWKSSSPTTLISSTSLAVAGNSAAIATFSTSNQVFAAYIALGDSPAAFPARQIGVGSASSVSHLGKFVLETHGNSYCYNTEARNKRPSPRLCDSTPSATPGVLTYSIGSFASWKARLTSDTNTSSLIHSCDSDILHGTYNQVCSFHSKGKPRSHFIAARGGTRPLLLSCFRTKSRALERVVSDIFRFSEAETSLLSL